MIRARIVTSTSGFRALEKDIAQSLDGAFVADDEEDAFDEVDDLEPDERTGD